MCDLFVVWCLSCNYNCFYSGEEDSLAIRWMWLHHGESKRCECGHWYKLVEVEPKDYTNIAPAKH